MQSRVRLAVGAIFTVVGLVLVGVGGVLAYSTVSFVQAAERTTGTVVDLDVRWGSHGSRSSSRAEYPVVEFEADGQRHTFSSGVTSTSHPEIGDTVSVLYDPAEPTDARLDSGLLNHLLELIFGGMGIVFAVFGSTLLVGSLRSRGTGRPPGPVSDAPVWTSDAVS